MTTQTDPAGKPGYWAQNMIALCCAKIGKPYVLGAVGPDAFDCSGLILWAARACGFSVPERWTTYTMVYLGDPVTPGTQMPGDWIFPDAGHVGLYIGGGQMVHAPEPGQNVKISPVWANWRTRRWVNPTSDKAGLDSAAIGAAGNALVTGLGNGISLGLEALGTTGQAAGQGLAEASPLAGINKVLDWLSDSHNWLRISMAVGGGIALALGAASMAGKAL